MKGDVMNIKPQTNKKLNVAKKIYKPSAPKPKMVQSCQTWWDLELIRLKKIREHPFSLGRNFDFPIELFERCKAQHEKEIQELTNKQYKWCQEGKSNTAKQIFAELEALDLADCQSKLMVQNSDYEQLKKKYGCGKEFLMEMN